jgi:hypothetical protein
MSDRHFYLAIAVIVITAWMLRWEITSQGNLNFQHFKHDRWTGITYNCASFTSDENVTRFECIEDEPDD